MKPIYCRLDVDFWLSSKVVAAGPYAAIIYQVLLGMNTKKTRHGHLNADDTDPKLLRAYLVPSFPRITVKQVSDALEKAIEVGLLFRGSGGTMGIKGWDDDWIPREPKSEAQRQREYRARMKGQHSRHRHEPVTEESRSDRDCRVTDDDGSVTYQSRTDRNGFRDVKSDASREESRGEQRRARAEEYTNGHS